MQLRRVSVDGQDRSYRVFVPPTLDRSRPAPLVLVHDDPRVRVVEGVVLVEGAGLLGDRLDELPQGALARYERDVASIAHVVSRRGAVPDQIQQGEEILVPTFEIAANPTVRLSEIKARRFYIVDRAQIKAKEAIQKEEDLNKRSFL